ncbi:MAG: QacE family quaternary ammonium compound efflux SMR transporter [Rubellimicrobium sp.]|nr:QacE family quaternary ammonium compound efflux SMR transporter [Rubellimicrobium sp.]
MSGIHILLALAIAAEVIATSALRASEQFTRLWPSVLVIIGYAIAFYLLSVAVRVIPTGIVYAVWSGLGIVLVALVGLFLGQKLDLAAVAGIGLILAGVLVINLFSATAGH